MKDYTGVAIALMALTVATISLSIGMEDKKDEKMIPRSHCDILCVSAKTGASIECPKERL